MSNALKIELTQGSEEWLRWRREGIGGSDAPVIDGTSPYRTKRQLYLEKTGKPSDEEDGSREYIFTQGHRVEKMIRSQFQELTHAEMNPACFQHTKFGYIRASLDGFDPNLGVLEAKLVGRDALNKARDGEIPEHHMTQIQHQLAVVEADVAQWFGHDGKKDGVLVTVKADRERIQRILDLEHTFWDDVRNGRIPPLSDRDYLIPDEDSLLRELRQAKEMAEFAEEKFKSLKELVVNTYGHTKIAGGGLKLFRTTKQGHMNLKTIPEVETLLKLLNPAYVESFRGKPFESWIVRLDSEKE